MYSVKFPTIIASKLPLTFKSRVGNKIQEINGKTLSPFFSMHNFVELEKICKDAVLIKRARHVIGEIERTKRAAESLKNQDFVKVS